MDQPIAVIGISCRLPGGVEDPDSLWDLCAEVKEAWSPIPADRYNHEAFYHPENTRAGSSNVKGGYFLRESLAQFDAPFFGLAKAEAEALDPQQRLLLECCYEALENAGIPLAGIKGSPTGVFASTFATDWNDILLRDPDSIPRYHCTGSGHCMLSNRLSYFLDTKGPCMTVDTACSGGLVATHLACQALRAGECDQVIVGGSNLVLNPDKTTSLSMLKFLSPDGRSYAFDHRANGYARGEGACCLVLKPLDKALQHGDAIRAVIRSTGVNQDGRTKGITMPNGDSQAKLISEMYCAAGFDPLNTGYVEAHGTGTATGDPIEAKALSQVFCRDRMPDNPLVIGSVKSNIGHLEGASGLASLVKVVLMLERCQFLPNANFQKPNADIPFADWKLKVSQELHPWISSVVRRASINSFGYGGTNAHVIIDEAKHYTLERRDSGYSVSGRSSAEKNATTPPTSASPRSEQLNNKYLIFVLSGQNEESTREIARKLCSYLAKHQDKAPSTFLKSLAYTLSNRRSLLPTRVAVTANSVPQLMNALQPEKLSPTTTNRILGLAFIFTGQGAQWFAMGRELFDSQEVFQATMYQANLCFKKLGAMWSLRDELFRDEETSRLSEAYLSQPICTAVQIALVDLLRSWEIRPTAVTGHSSGEIAAAYAAGALSFADALKIAYCRGRCVADAFDSGTLQPGAMMAVGLSAEAGQQMVATTTKGKAVVACFNSPNSLTLSGDVDAINEIEETLKEQKVFARKLLVQTAYHSHHMNAVASVYQAAISDTTALPAKSISFYSSVEGRIVDMSDLGPDYWVKNLLNPVRFVEAFQALCTSYQKSGRSTSTGSLREVVCVEIGPHSALSGPIKQISQEGSFPKGLKLRYVPSLVRGRSAGDTMLALGGNLFECGYQVNLNAVNQIHPNEKQVLTDLPPYPWNRSVTYWAETSRSKAYRTRQQPRHDLLGAPVPTNNHLEPQWRNLLRPLEMPWMRDHRIQDAITYPFAGFAAMAIEAASQKAGSSGLHASGYKLREVSIEQALVIEDGSDYNEVIFSMRPYAENSRASSGIWDEFRIFSISQAGTVEHCRGLISVVCDETSDDGEACIRDGAQLPDVAQFKRFEADCATPIDLERFYGSLSEIGIEYGPTFANLVNAKVGERGCVARLAVPDTASTMPQHFEFPCIIHPGTLDSTLHAFLATFVSQTSRLNGAVVPTFLKEMYVAHSGKNKPGDNITVLATIEPEPGREFSGSLLAFDEADADQKVLIRMSGLTLTSLGQDASQQTEELQTHPIFRTIWEKDLALMSVQQKRDLLSAPESTRQEKADAMAMEQAAFYFAEQALAQIKSADTSRVKDYHEKQIAFLSNLCDKVYNGQSGSKTWLGVDEKSKEALFKSVDSSGDEGSLLVQVGKNLSSIILGDVEALSVMIEDDRLEKYYRNMASTKLLSESAAKYANLLAHKNPSLRILEVGAGTGGTSFPILEQLGGRDGAGPRFSVYDYTDISSGFFEKPRQKAQPWGKLVQFRKLDIEEDPSVQGFEAESYDLIVAANVLHATKSMKKTLSHIRKLLKPGGQLLLIELTAAKTGTSLIFGTLPGWWLAQEPYRKQGPLMTEQQWDILLKESDLSGTELCVWDTPSTDTHQASMMLSQVLMEMSVKHPSVTIVSDAEPSGHLESYLQKLFLDANIDCKINTIADADCSERMCICVAEVVRPILHNLNAERYEKLRHLLTTSSGILWVKRVGKNHPEWGMGDGLIRTLRTEVSGTTLMTLDLEDVERFNERQAAEYIFMVFNQGFMSDSAPEVAEAEYRESGGALYIPRITKDNSTSKFIDTRLAVRIPEEQPFFQKGRPLKLHLGSPGLLSSLHFTDDDKVDLELLPNEIEIEVKATGINFRDVMQALGQIKFRALGTECSGVISRVGQNVQQHKPGDRVVAFVNDAFAHYVRAAAQHVHKLPVDVPFDVGAAMPLVYWTALHAVKVAQIAKGEKVLVHAAMGGLGQALVTLCQHKGAEVFATVGTIEKRKLLKETYGIPDDHIFNSRNGTFAKGIMRQTMGVGVDVVMNCVAGDLLRQTWECMTDFGRFIELGVKDIMVNSRLEMAPFIRNLTYAAVNMLDVIEKRPKYIGQLWEEVVTLLQEGKIKAPQPITVFPIADLEKALRAMQSGNNIGKMVVVPQADDVVKAIPAGTSKALFHSESTYVLVGGLGGLGRAIASWMVCHGAKHIAFLSRSGSAHTEAESTINALEKQGARSLVMKCDITCSEDVNESLAVVSRKLAPIRGVMQLAMVMRNDMFQQMSFDDWEDSIQPKVRGTWNLHKSLLQTPLDFFINFSSLVGLIGNASQAAYAAASSFLDEFAAYRHNLGLPVTTIDLGAVLEVGYVAENERVMLNLQRQGLKVVREKELLALIECSVLRETPDQEGKSVVLGLGDWTESNPLIIYRTPKYSHFRGLGMSTNTGHTAEDEQVQATRIELRSATSLQQASDMILKAVSAKAASLLMIPVAQVDESKTLAAQGIDSLVAVEMRNWLSSDMGCSLSVLELMANQPLSELSAQILQKLKLEFS